MKEVIVHPLPTLHTEIIESPIPIPGDDEVVIRVMVAGSNVKGLSSLPLSFPLSPSHSQNPKLKINLIENPGIDYAHLIPLSLSLNSGDDIAGYIHAVGSKIQRNGEWRV